MPQATTQAQAAAAHSASHDSAAVKPPFVPRYTQGFPPLGHNDSAITHIDQLPVMQQPATVPPQSRAHSPVHDAGTMTLILLSLFLLTVSYRKGYKYIENFVHNMFSVRQRENLFEDHTVNEMGMLTALIVNTSVQLGVLSYYAFDFLMPSMRAGLASNVTLHVGLFAGIWLLYFGLQLALYNVLGWTFGNRLTTRLWTDGFKSSQGLLGLLLLPVTVLLLVHTIPVKVTLGIAFLLYLLARIVFVCKGFRIFFNNIQDWVYFLLYLCTIEIVPPVLVIGGTVYICNLFQR